jgi:ribosomal protein L3 glutamine methyltransferase
MIDYSSAAKELSSLRDFLRWTTSKFSEAGLFYGHGNEDAFNEAMQLILHSLYLPVIEFPELFIDCRLTTQEKQQIVELVKKRIEKRIPVPYLTKEAWFAQLPFFVDERVLIPRSPFAELIAEEFSPWLIEPDSVTNILDLCTGSACIAIACAYAFPDASVDAIDISSDAIDVANINIEKHNIGDRVTAIQSNLWQHCPDKHYDLIVSNPPYVGMAEMQTLPAEYKHEPELALKAEDNGLAIVEQILLKAAEFLSPDGILIVEVGNSDEAVVEKWPETPFTWLEFEQGGHGLFMLDATQCQQFSERYN